MLEDIVIFPNPFHSNITLTLPEATEEDLSVSLINDIGQELFTELIRPGSRKTVNLRFPGISGLQTGLYFLKIKTKGEVYVFKLIKV